MKIIFYSTWDDKLAKLVADNYFDFINTEKLPVKIREIFLAEKKQQPKNIYCVTEQDNSLQIIALGCYGQEQIIFNLITSLNDIFSIKEKIVLINIDILYNIFIKLGLSAVHLNLKRLGLFLLKKGISQEIPKIKNIIKKTKERIAEI